MPRLDGLEVCRRLRAAGDRTPVLMLTARDAVADRVAGLDAGADDYLVKPFALEELLARAARAAAPRRRAPSERARCASPTSTLDPAGHEVRRGERPHRADPHRVPAAGAVPAPPAPGADARADLRARLGLRLRPDARTRSRSTSATCAARSRPAASRGCSTRCAASATCCGSRDAPRCSAACRSGAGCCWRPSRSRSRLAALGTAFVVVRAELRGQIDDSLAQRPAAAARRRCVRTMLAHGPPPAADRRRHRRRPDAARASRVRPALQGRTRYVQRRRRRRGRAGRRAPQLPADRQTRGWPTAGAGRRSSPTATLGGVHVRVFTPRGRARRRDPGRPAARRDRPARSGGCG